MSRSLPVLCVIAFAGSLFAQRPTAPSRYGSPSGFGSILYPGVGHAPVQAPLGTVSRRGGGNILSPGLPPRMPHPGHVRRVIVPVPVYVGGYGYGYGYDLTAQQPPPGYGYDDSPQQPATPPVVIINQGYRPEVANPQFRDYSDAQLPETGPRTYEAPVHPFPDPRDQVREDPKPTIYLIAFKDHTILPALAYWVDGDTLNYITEQGTPNRASLALIDKDFSKQLNRERRVEFSLP